LEAECVDERPLLRASADNSCPAEFAVSVKADGQSCACIEKFLVRLIGVEELDKEKREYAATHTNYDIRLSSFLLQHLCIFSVADYNAHVGESLSDCLRLLFRAHESCVAVFWVFVVEGVQGITTNVAGHARAIVI
jgi:hypothetical protein